MKCENCEQEHDGTYGSGRFCSTKCSRGFATKGKRKEISAKISNSLTGRCSWDNSDRPCKECKQLFKPKKKHQVLCSKSCSAKYTIRTNPLREISSEDWSEIHKKAYKEGRNYVGGGTTKWLPYKDIRVQGTYELRMCIVLDKMKDKGLIFDWEYTGDRFCYIGLDDEEHTYLLDFKVYNEDGTFYYIETKGYQTDNDKLKWDSVGQNGFELKVMFDEDIKKLEDRI